MRVLLDECLPRRLKAYLADHQVTTVPEAGWAGRKNGDLLRVAAGVVDAFITVDSNLAYHLLGHDNIHTTTRYARVSAALVSKAKSPLDRLPKTG
jgi:hypothetical protein